MYHQILRVLLVSWMLLVGTICSAIAASDGFGSASVCFEDEVKVAPDQIQSFPPSIVFLNVSPETTVDAYLVTIKPIVLAGKARCADVPVAMMKNEKDLPQLLQATIEGFSSEAILNYSGGQKGSPIDATDLIYGERLRAKLLTSVSRSIEKPALKSEVELVGECESMAEQLRLHFKTSIRTDQFPFIYSQEWQDHKMKMQFSVNCYGNEFYPVPSPDISAYWDNSGQPNQSDIYWASAAASPVIGVSNEQIQIAINKCVTEALKPASKELANIFFDGAKIECQAFERDGGGGSVTIFRVAGKLPRLK